jgi:hypothetical protein
MAGSNRESLVSLEPSPDPAALVAAIRGPSPRYKREAVAAIAAHPRQTVPHLLAILREVLQDPRGYLERAGADFGVIYAIVLLAHLREPLAHELIVRIARLPDDVLDPLLGDFLTEEMGNVLLLTCGGQTEGLRAILQDRAANEYSRSQAARALVMAVHMGYAERDEVLAFLAALLVPEAAPEGSYVQTAMLIAMLDLHPVEHEDAFRRAWDAELIEAAAISWENIEEDLARAPEAAERELAQRCEQAQRADVHDWLSWWACFQPSERTAPAPRPPPPRKLARNGPCWCGSGGKYKGCHYPSDQAAAGKR